MIINIIKDISWITQLERYNNDIIEVHSNYTFPSYYDVTKNEASHWFNPVKYREAQLSRTYPKIAPEQYRKEYKLIFYLPNYVTLFLIKELYKNRKDVLIEDCGPGSGNLILFLSKLGFTAFNVFDKFLQCPKQLFVDMMQKGNINYTLNDFSVKPIVVNNCSAPFTFITHGLDKNCLFRSKAAHSEINKEDAELSLNRDVSSLELICFYTNREWEKLAYKILPQQGYSFLCKDSDDMGVAWCRNDKLEEFQMKLKQYSV